MTANGKPVTDETVELLARSLYRETAEYGFQQIDYLRFVNMLLDMSAHPSAPEANGAAPTAFFDVSEPVELPLKDRDICVRAFDRKRDTCLLEGWLKDEEGRYFLLSRTTAKRENLDDILADGRNTLGMITLVDGTPIGALAYLDYDRVQRKAELRKMIGELAYRGRGYAKKATELWIRYGIGNLKLRKIYLSTLDTNVRNIRLNEDLGFKVEGILRDECFFDGGYHDVLRMGLVNSEKSSKRPAKVLVRAK
jgi:RimJ/RimL family protein N-acetyltransferase